MLQLPDFIQKQIVIIDPRSGTDINDLKFKMKISPYIVMGKS